MKGWGWVRGGGRGKCRVERRAPLDWKDIGMVGWKEGSEAVGWLAQKLAE